MDDTVIKPIPTPYITRDDEIVFPTPSEIYSAALTIVLAPIRYLTSRTAQRAYIATFLLVATGIVLIPVATSAYGLLYFRYVPQLSLRGPIHLQFDVEPLFGLHTSIPPHGVLDLGSKLITQQAYDVSVRLRMPRAETNIHAGNFMIDVALLDKMPNPINQGAIGVMTDAASPSTAVPPPPRKAQRAADAHALAGTVVLAHARRPALLTYTSPLTEKALTLFRLPWTLLFGPAASSDIDTLVVPMMENVVFPRGWRNVPHAARVSLESRERLWVYSAELEIRAKLSGLRYLMYNYRITSFLTFTSIFWLTEMTIMILFYAALSYIFSGPRSSTPLKTLPGQADPIKPRPATVKDEEDEDADLTEDMSDTSRSFPTYSRQPMLRYSGAQSPRRVKQEEEDEEAARVAGLGARAGVLEADDEDDDGGAGVGRVKDEDEEDEDVDFVTDGEGRVIGGRSDSGLGTSMESGVPSTAEALRRRRSGKGA